jgi:hypothetical protein
MFSAYRPIRSRVRDIFEAVAARTTGGRSLTEGHDGPLSEVWEPVESSDTKYCQNVEIRAHGG